MLKDGIEGWIMLRSDKDGTESDASFPNTMLII
jgi:hypothetical protein